MSILTTIIVAGGRGLRMGEEIPKQFLPVGGRPVLMHTIDRLLSYDPSMAIVLVLPGDHIEYWKALCRTYHYDRSYRLAFGGETRFQSVKNGLEQVADSDLVAIHDGVRPFVSPETIQRCCHAAQENGAAIPVMEVVETLRKVEGGRSAIRPRESYRAVQTPQVFRALVIRHAYELPEHPGFTDDASVVEAAGYDVTLVEGNRENIKITSPFDLAMAAAMLEK